MRKKKAENNIYMIKTMQINKKKKKTLFLLFTFYFLVLSSSHAAFIDRVVAFVDDQAITLSEFQQQFQQTSKLVGDIKEEDVLNTIINRKLLLREAKKYRIEASSEEEIIKEFIDLKVSAFIRVSEAEIEEFYRQNENQFSGKEFEIVREEIEKYLAEKELNERLKGMINELKKNVYIKIQLKP